MVAGTEKEAAEWKVNQKNAYDGSLKHLLKSVTTNTLTEEGFRMYQIQDTLVRRTIRLNDVKGPKIADPKTNRKEIYPQDIVRPGKLPSERLITAHSYIEVFYTKKHSRSPYSDMSYQYSVISLPAKTMIVTTQGWVVEPRGFVVEGYLSTDRLSTLLPADWKE